VNVSEGLRERKKAETRRALASAALRLADRHGPDRVTVEAIAEAANVSPRTFFNYFATKDDAIVGVAPVSSSTLMQGLLARPDDEPPLAALRAAVHTATDVIVTTAGDWEARHRVFQQHPHLAARHASMFAEVERGLAEEVARRANLDVDRDVYPALVTSAALAATRVAITTWQALDRSRPLSEVVDEAFDVIAAGFALRVPALAEPG
jgi:AcrR family transcriptional regulator